MPTNSGITIPYFRSCRTNVRISAATPRHSRDSLIVNQSAICVDRISSCARFTSMAPRTVRNEPALGLYHTYRTERIRTYATTIKLAIGCAIMLLIVAALILAMASLSIDTRILRPQLCANESVVNYDDTLYVCYLNQQLARIHSIDDAPTTPTTRSCRVGPTHFDAPDTMLIDYEARDMDTSTTSQPRRHTLHISRHFHICIWTWIRSQPFRNITRASHIHHEYHEYL